MKPAKHTLSTLEPVEASSLMRPENIRLLNTGALSLKSSIITVTTVLLESEGTPESFDCTVSA